MGLGLSGFIPLAVYIVGIIVIFLDIFVNPAIGVYFLFPLLPYQNIIEKIRLFPMGKDLNDIVMISILIGCLIRNKKPDIKNNSGQSIRDIIKMPVILIAISSFIGIINASFNSGSAFTIDNIYLVAWKNYMMLPLIWFLTTKTIRDKKGLQILTLLLVLGFLGAGRYFYSNLQWMNLWHYSHRTRNMMTGLFVYLGANHYGAFFAHFVFILFGLMLFIKSKIKKVILLGIMSLAVYCIVYTFSRGAYLAFLVGTVFIALVKEKKIFLLLVVLLVFWRTLMPTAVVERIEMTKDESTGELEHSAKVRLEMWDTAWQMFKESPLIGKGFNTFRYEEWTDTHNYYLKMLAEMGFVGLMAFIYLLFASFKVGWKLYRRSEDWFFSAMGLGFAATVIAVSITNLFGDRWTYLPLGAYFWVFLGIVSRAYKINEQDFIVQQQGKL